ncbi:28S ribosomal protein S18c [Porites harrisoni]
MATWKSLSDILGLPRFLLLSHAFTGTRNSFLSPLGCLSSVYCRSFHMSAPVDGKYHHTAKKRKLRKRRMAQLRSRFERLDEEDRPTGCLLCPKRTDVEINYKNVRLLSQFLSPHTGRMYGRTLTGLCDKKQTEISRAIRRARAIGFMPVTMKYVAFHNDPKLF